jgi:hypothetical protein
MEVNMGWSNAQIKDLLREILKIVKEIKAQQEIPVMNVLEDVPLPPEPVFPTYVVDKKAEKRRIFLERMRLGREKAKAKKGLPIL